MKIVPKEIDFRDRNLVFVDLETTGFDVERHEIIEIGSIIAGGKTFEILSEYHTKVTPLHIETASPEALRINGYSKDEWEAAASIEEALKKLNEIAKDGMFVGWNIAFDWSFLGKNFERFKVKPLFDYHLIDAMSIAYSRLHAVREVSRLSLRHVATFFGIKMNSLRHDAMTDIHATYEIFKNLMKKNE